MDASEKSEDYPMGVILTDSLKKEAARVAALLHGEECVELDSGIFVTKKEKKAGFFLLDSFELGGAMFYIQQRI